VLKRDKKENKSFFDIKKLKEEKEQFSSFLSSNDLNKKGFFLFFLLAFLK